MCTTDSTKCFWISLGSGLSSNCVLKNAVNVIFIFQLVSNALQFLATVADRSHYRHLFEDPAVLSSICEKVIIPNMEFRGKNNYNNVFCIFLI